MLVPGSVGRSVPRVGDGRACIGLRHRLDEKNECVHIDTQKVINAKHYVKEPWLVGWGCLPKTDPILVPGMNMSTAY